MYPPWLELGEPEQQERQVHFLDLNECMARWHSMAIKIIRQATQTGGNGPEIERVPPCGIEACHQMQIWNYYKSTLSLRQRMHTHKRFPSCVGGFIRNLHQKGIQPKNHGSVFLQLGST